MPNADLSNVQLVALAVFQLGGERKAVDVEDVAVQAYRMTPHKFAWKKYPEMIDKTVVLYAMKDASLPKNGPPMLAGSVKHGYLLTSFGLDWVKSYQEKIDITEVFSFRSNSNLEKLVLERTRLETTPAYRKFLSNELDSISEGDFQDFTRINEYFPEHARRRRFTIIENAIQDQPQLESCWQYLRSRFT